MKLIVYLKPNIDKAKIDANISFIKMLDTVQSVEAIDNNCIKCIADQCVKCTDDCSQCISNS